MKHQITFEQLIDNADDHDDMSESIDMVEDTCREYVDHLASLSLVIDHENETIEYDDDMLPLLLAATRAADRMIDVMQSYIIVDAIDYNTAPSIVVAALTEFHQ